MGIIKFIQVKKEQKESINRVKIIAHKEILSFKEALIYLDVSESFLYKLTSKKAIEFTKPNGGKIYFRKSVLDNWMLKNDCKSSGVLENEIFNHLNKNNNG